MLELDLIQQRDPVSAALIALGFTRCVCMALDAGVSVLGVVLALDRQARVASTDERITGVQLAVMLAVALARLDDQSQVRKKQRQSDTRSPSPAQGPGVTSRAGTWSPGPASFPA